MTRVFYTQMEKRLNQLQAYVNRARDETMVNRSSGNSQDRVFQAQLKNVTKLEIEICELRSMLDEFKSSEDLQSKKHLRDKIKKQLDSLNKRYFS